MLIISIENEDGKNLSKFWVSLKVFSNMQLELKRTEMNSPTRIQRKAKLYDLSTCSE